LSQAGSINNSGGSLVVPVTVPNGGTGQTTFPNHTVLIGQGTSAIGNAGPGDANSVLIGQGAAADPIFATLEAGLNTDIVITGGVVTIAETDPSRVVNMYDDFIVWNKDSTVVPVSNYAWFRDDDVFSFTTSLQDSGHPGVISNQAMGASDNWVLIANYPNMGIILGGGEITINWIAKIAILSATTPRYTLRCGLGDTIYTGDQANGVYFEYSDNINSGQWALKTANSSTRTTSNTATLVTQQWYNLKIVINAAGTSAEYFVNSVSLGTVNTNLPVLGVSPFFKVERDAGTVALNTFGVDAMYLHQTLTNQR